VPRGNHDGVLRKICVLTLVAALLALLPAAYADPPDPTWLGGYWDDDDFDNVVILIADTCAVAAQPLLDSGPLWTVVVGLELMPRRFVQVSARAAASPRAPPVAPLSVS
jgi:hypothetical protein